MADIKKVATRESYGNALAELGDKYENLYVFDADLAAATKTGIFKKKFPDRFFDCGIAESNMMGVAAGMAATGKIPFVSTFAMFAAGRAFEQVRNSIGYPHLNVKIGATHAGISVGEDGATHQCNEDIALMRTIPGMTVIIPADDVEAKAAVEAAINYEGPVYMRFGRLAVPVFNDPETYKFEIGKGIKLRDGKDITIVATGLMVYEAIEAIDKDIIIQAAKNTDLVLTVEEHSVIGGLGEAVCDVLCENYPTKVVKIGVNDVFGHSGPAVDLLKQFGLSAENIVKTAKEAVKAK